MASKTRPPRMCVGCSGWNYKSWRTRFYPTTLPASQWLTWYAQRFHTVEINNSFYRLPAPETFAAWREQTPADFIFAVKASRFLTHMKQLRDPEEPLERLFSRARRLGRKLGPVLYQLPARLECDLGRLEPFLKALPPRVQHVIEFRHPSWYVPPVFERLEHHHVALCLHDKEGSTIHEPFLSPFIYVRFHGTSGHYHGSYADHVLKQWARRLAAASTDGRDVYAFFNNDVNAEATRDATTLKEETTRLLNASSRTRKSSFKP
jgi:uncharacterized protein YecE (DUF72 family)